MTGDTRFEGPRGSAGGYPERAYGADASRGVRNDRETAASGSSPKAAAAAARADLATTLDEIQDRLNVPARVKRSIRQNATPWIAAGVGAAVAVAGIVTLVVLSRRTR
jgi:hypothetical protein